MDSLSPLNTLNLDQSIIDQRVNSTSPSPLTWVSSNWSKEKSQFDFTPTFMLESNVSSNSIKESNNLRDKNRRRTSSPVTDEEGTSTDEGEGEEEEEEGSWENSSNPSATTEASTSTNSSHQPTTTSKSKPAESPPLSKLQTLDPQVVETLKKKNLSPTLIASAAATPFTPSLKSIDIQVNTTPSSNYDPIPPTTSFSNFENSDSTEFRGNNSLNSNFGRISPQCEWTLNESGVLKNNNDEDGGYEIAEEILQLQITPPQQIQTFIGDRVSKKNGEIDVVGRREFFLSTAGLNGVKGNNHSRNSSYSSSATFESDLSNRTKTSSTSSYITSTTTPDRSPPGHKTLNGSSHHFSPAILNTTTRIHQSQSPTPGINTRNTYSNSNNTTQLYSTSQNQSQPQISTFSNLHVNESNLYNLALQSFLFSSLPSPSSLSITSDPSLEELTNSLTTHFNHSMTTSHPLASLYGLTLAEGDTLIRSPRDNGVREEIWRLGVERMKFGLFSVSTNGGEGSLRGGESGEGGSDWDEEGPSAGNRKFGLYKTELCRSWEEKGMCRYGTRCQFAHGTNQVREIARHPKFKSEICRTFWIHGECPYGRRCCFLHTTGPNHSSNLNTFPSNQVQQLQQYPSLINLSEYFEPSASYIPTRAQLQLQQQQQQQQQQNHLANNNQSFGKPFAPSTSQRPQFNSNNSNSYEASQQSPTYPLTPPYSNTTTTTSSSYLDFKPTPNRTLSSSELFSPTDYFSSPTNSNSTSLIPCASPPVPKTNSASLHTTLESMISPELVLERQGGGKKLEPIGAEKLKGKIFTRDEKAEALSSRS